MKFRLGHHTLSEKSGVGGGEVPGKLGITEGVTCFTWSLKNILADGGSSCLFQPFNKLFGGIAALWEVGGSEFVGQREEIKKSVPVVFAK